MFQTTRILVTWLFFAASLASLVACGQPGPLYLPTEPAAANRATLPQSLRPNLSSSAPTAPTAPPSAQ